MNKRTLWLIIPLLLIIGYLMGPKPPTPVYKKDMPAVPEQSAKLEEYIQEGESMHKVKKDNEARIVWFNDSVRGKTEYAVVYLHGFGASQAEGDPVHRSIAKKFGCNLYLARLGRAWSGYHRCNEKTLG